MPEENKPHENQTGRSVQFDVSGMKCAGCEEAVSSALTQHPAVESVQAKAAEGKVHITLRNGADPAELAQRIESAGFHVASGP